MSLFYIGISSIWFLSEVLISRRLRSNSTDKQQLDNHSLPLIWITILITISLAVFIATYTSLPMHRNILVYDVGLLIILVGIILRLVTIHSLGQWFTVDVTIRQNHRLKTDGFYKYVRHPAYFSSFLSFIGFGITLNNWLAFLLITLVILTMFGMRIKIEEKVLIAQFGSEYLAYKKRTKKIIPFIY